MYAIADLDSAYLSAVQEFEARHEVTLVALEETAEAGARQRAGDLGVTPARLDEATLEELRRLERGTGLCLLAVES